MTYTIVFLGSDGSGKSTLLDHTKKKLEEKGKTVDVVFMGWKHFKNPLLRALSRRHMKRKATAGKKEEKLARYRARGWGFYFVYYSELWLRYLHVLFSRKDYVLLDRYFYDELAFSTGMKRKLFTKITPRPDICFVVHADVKTLRKRGVTVKKELLENFYEKIHRLSEHCKMVEIDNSGKLTDTYRIIDINLYK